MRFVERLPRKGLGFPLLFCVILANLQRLLYVASDWKEPEHAEPVAGKLENLVASNRVPTVQIAYNA